MYMKKLSEILAAIGLALLVFSVGYILGRHCELDRLQKSVGDTSSLIVMRDTVMICDTVVEPVPVSSVILRHDTIVTPKDTVYLPVERKTYEQIIDNDSVKGSIRTMVSGYDLNLDSLTYNLRFTRDIIYMKQRKRWGWNVTAGPAAGYGPHGFQPYIGITVGYGFNF